MTVSIILDPSGQDMYIAPTLHWLTYAAQLASADASLEDILYSSGEIRRDDIHRIVQAIRKSEPDSRITKMLLAALSEIQKSGEVGVLDTALGIQGEASDKSDEPDEVQYTGNEDVDAVLFAESMVNKALTRDRARGIIEALLRVTVPDSFQALSPPQARLAMEKLVDAMTQSGGWSVSGVVDDLKKAFPTVDDFQLRRIVRTESARISTKAHEIEAVENDPPTARYKWRGPKDWRTCKIHKAILERQPAEGLPLNDLKVLVAQVAGEFKVQVQDDWIVHPNQRGSFTRVFSFSH